MFVNGYYNKRREDRYNWALGAAEQSRMASSTVFR